jgi:hypothetical protein
MAALSLGRASPTEAHEDLIASRLMSGEVAVGLAAVAPEGKAAQSFQPRFVRRSAGVSAARDAMRAIQHFSAETRLCDLRNFPERVIRNGNRTDAKRYQFLTNSGAPSG